jgi:plasmid stabilization system protein ParE
MAYKITISPLAELELAEAYSYYAEISLEVLKTFDKEILASYEGLKMNPFFQERYKNVRGLPLKKFPFIIFFTLNENNNTVEIRSVFHTDQDSKKYR